MTLIILLVTATSVDALVVGLSLAAQQIDMIFPSVMIGVITSFLCVLAIAGGRFIGVRM